MRARRLAILPVLACLLGQGILLSAAGGAGPTPGSSASPPKAKIRFSTDNFAPVEGKDYRPLVATIEPSPGGAPITSWEMTVYDPGALPFKVFKGRWPTASVEWDGRGTAGDLVESASRYAFVAKLRDANGGIGEARAVLNTGIILLKGASRYRIGISSIVFKPDTADYLDVSAAQKRRNLETLRLLSAKLKAFPGYGIRIEGHAVLTNWNDKTAAAAEQRDSLIPLSKARAEAIKAALSAAGIPRAAITTLGLGAKDPVVPDSDLKNRWKNRRVEIFLEP